MTAATTTTTTTTSTDLTHCEIHVDQSQDITSHIFGHRYYDLSIFLKCKGVPKYLEDDSNVELITTIICSDTRQPLSSDEVEFDHNPCRFNQSGHTSTRFMITGVFSSPQHQLYRIQCIVANSPMVKPWISDAFAVVQYKFGAVRDLCLIDGDKWYKDEGGKTNFLHLRLGLFNHREQHIKVRRNVEFEVELVYEADHSRVRNQEILRVESDQSYVLQHTNGAIDIRFKIEQVSSHHQRRRFQLKVSSRRDASIGPCLSRPILVLSKRNKPRKPLNAMSPQKQKEVVTKREKRKLLSMASDHNNNNNMSDVGQVKQEMVVAQNGHRDAVSTATAAAAAAPSSQPQRLRLGQLDTTRKRKKRKLNAHTHSQLKSDTTAMPSMPA
eukprot:CAMPEP_0202695878 /NCGR_PEP_ID=MMETSP1385-20130828/9331_1 /ASSEMBLY_ACC=CAM_ASM_000861 /TAXON_ID=933848 /ORGANISM="Elphidium margaritaceum" /LENGTH=382 /DNA_ID=CAMNT_0049351957 /DNA_START=26 /DNA_END=1170 /DNA_ORIENTATION=+